MFLPPCMNAFVSYKSQTFDLIVSRLQQDEIINFLHSTLLFSSPILWGWWRNITMKAHFPRLDLRCVCVCVWEGEKRPIKEQRGQVCSYCFSLSPWKPKRGWPQNWYSTMNLVCVCVCEGLWGKLKCHQGSIYDTVHRMGWHYRGDADKDQQIDGQ